MPQRFCKQFLNGVFDTLIRSNLIDYWLYSTRDLSGYGFKRGYCLFNLVKSLSKVNNG